MPQVQADSELGSPAVSVKCSHWWSQGRTNREIGANLFISEKTASVHVSNILPSSERRTE